MDRARLQTAQTVQQGPRTRFKRAEPPQTARGALWRLYEACGVWFGGDCTCLGGALSSHGSARFKRAVAPCRPTVAHG